MASLTSPGARLFLTSFLALYAELLCIRWVPAYVRFVSYFTNFILLASFLGLGAGILLSRRAWPAPAERVHAQPAPPAARRSSFSTLSGSIGLLVFPWLLLAIVGFVAVSRFELRIESAGVLYYGAGESGAPPPENALVLPAAFLLVSLLFTCLGRELGLLLARVTPPLRAYAIDIAGSLAGVAAFFVLALTQQAPAVWFGGLLVLVALLAAPSLPRLAVALPPLAACVAIAHALGSGYVWSPYYRVGITPMQGHPTGHVLTVNTIGHQMLTPAEEKEPFYRVPYELFGLEMSDRQPDGRLSQAPAATAAGSPLQRALIIGAGSGSDVAVALRYGVRHVDAVEIDPAITQYGRAFHPDRPYQDPRVRLHVDDGRAFLRRSPDRYDLIIFALPDSLTLTSQFASLRLESFLFTRESMAEARDHLTDRGVVVLYNFYRETWLLRKIAGMMEDAFGAPPYTVSYGGWGRAAVLVNGPGLRRLLPSRPDLAAPYAEHDFARLRLEDDPDAELLPVIGAGLLSSAATGGFLDAGEPATQAAPHLATDDWPLMYLPRPSLPGVYLAGLGMVALCALGLVLAAGGRQARRGFDPHMFFLGVAFMLLETRSLVGFGLLFGNTWLVNSLVFFAILCSVLLAVGVGARLPLRPSPPLYAALLAALLLAYALPETTLLGLDPPLLRYAVAGGVAFLPIFLANLVFAGSFKQTGPAADTAFASNLLGAMAGGMLEYTALLWGYRHLLLLALACYALAALLGSRLGRLSATRPVTAPAASA
jgi:hypothetical protein